MKRCSFLFVAAVVLLLISAESAFGQWSDPAPLNTNAATDSQHDGGPAVATDGAGNWVAVWISINGILLSRSTDNGATWTDPRTVVGTGAWFQQVATDGAGNWVCVWSSSGGVSVAWSTVYDGGTWTAPTLVDDDGMEPHVTTDGAGNWVCVWTSEDDLVGTIGTDWDIPGSSHQQ
jgi:hypothetical protein